MPDPNAVYKEAFRELQARLGRVPTATELLPAHEEYKKAYEEEKGARQSDTPRASGQDVRPGAGSGARGGAHKALRHGIDALSGSGGYEVANAAAGRPAPAGFSRQPAPQAGAIGADTRTREGGAVAGEPLSGPGIIPEPEQAESEPERPSVNCGLPDGLILGRRGPAGGIVATCVTCSAPFERPNAKGRPPVRCEGCR